ncbi:hypothetical protein J1N35_031311 [Gossypium stocksii]|uniref:Translation initiation factor eIF2B subunit alpha n=1 Tax=Gossypium stocksii TaxID=47602 RepID=A0A9D3ZVJ5_9ROSI|nr:hypothetical protein J1N35_031311 [Gossypium stocksii]
MCMNLGCGVQLIGMWKLNGKMLNLSRLIPHYGWFPCYNTKSDGKIELLSANHFHLVCSLNKVASLSSLCLLCQSWDTTSISLTAGCDLFMLYVTRTSALEYEDFNSAKSRLIERAEKFGEISCKARRIIAMLSRDFIFDGCTILVHGFSRVVLEVLKTAAENKKHFRVLCTEGRPDRTGLRFSNELAKLDVAVKLLIDSAVAYTMDEVDMVLFGADGVVESGGIINMMGTFQIALVAHSMNKPVYVAAESYKFARHYPLDQKDMSPARRPIDFGVPIPSKVEVETSARDYTPPQYLTLLFTDLGVLTPSVISDELIQLYL